MNLYESLKRNIKESDNICCRHCHTIIDDIDDCETDKYWTNDGDRIVYHKCPECGESIEELDFDNDNEMEESDESERVDLFLRNDYGDWIDYLWYYPSTGKFFAPFEEVSHAEAWKRLNDPQVKQAVSDSWGENTEKVYKEMLDYLKSCDDLNESELKESYDTINVIEEVQSDLENLISNLEGQVSNDIGKDVVIQTLKSILTKLEKNSEEAW